jgi:hypothetical protein
MGGFLRQLYEAKEEVKMGWYYSVAKSRAFVATAACGLVAMSPAFAGPTINIAPDSFLWLGLVGRYSYATEENHAADGKDWSNNFSLEEARLYMHGQAMKLGDSGDLAFQLDFASDSGDTIRTLDAYTQFDFNDYVRFWFGRMIPPCDRASLEAPLDPTTFDYPLMSADQIMINKIRDEAATFWGELQGGMYKYYFAVSRGRQGGPNQKDNLRYSLRLNADFLDPEPGYYPMAWYDGAKKIASVGASYQTQNDGAGNVGLAGPGIIRAANWKETSIDYRVEIPDATGGIIDSEGAWYNYDLGNVTDTSGFLVQGHGYFVTGGYVFPQKVGIGKIEPRVVWQQFYRSSVNTVGSRGKQQRFDLGVNYLIKGHDIRVDGFWYHVQQPADQVPVGQSSYNGVKVLVQFFL